MDKLSPADARIAAKSLREVIEYIEVTRLRGGPSAHMKKAEAAPIPGFDPLDLDL